jgi:hypothetical protein
MTTGRINQVTILKVGPQRSRHTTRAQQSWLLIGRLYTVDVIGGTRLQTPKGQQLQAADTATT